MSERASPGTLHGLKAAYVVLLLFGVNVFNFIDRQLPSILAQSIKADLKLTDTQLGLLTGLAFAVVYATLALPLARLADKWSAKWVLTGSLLVWSALTAAGAGAQSFLQLAASRLGVAAGEAGSTPAAHAFISSTIAPKWRGVALGAFSVGIPIGSMCGLAIGGWLNDLHSWRFVMVAMGAPGLVLAMVFAATAPQAPRRDGVASSMSLAASARWLLGLKTYRHLCFGVTVFGVGVYASYAFAPSFLIRTYALTTADAGLRLGLLSGIAGGVGAFGGGWLGDVLARGGRHRMLLLPAVGFAVAAPLMIAAWLAPTADWALGLLAAPYLANVMYVAPTFGAAQRLAPPAMRATASAILLFCLSLLGASFGPYLVGALSDLLRPRYGPMSLRYALCFASVTQLWAAVHFVIAARAFREPTGDLSSSGEQSPGVEQLV